MRTIREAPRRIGEMILVTGGTGFVGSRIVHALRTEDRPVRCLVRKPERAAQLDAWGCELVQGDVTDPEASRAPSRASTRSSTWSRSSPASPRSSSA